MVDHVCIKVKGRLGAEPKDMTQMRVLNRLVTITQDGLEYEPDPRHAELRARDMGLGMDVNSAMTPWHQTRVRRDQTPA